MNPKYHLLAVVAALSFGACTTDDTCTGPEIGGYKLSFTVAEDSETRTTLDKDDKERDYLRWVPTDEVGIYTVGQNVNSNILTVADVNKSPVEFTGTLKHQVSPGDQFYAYYPYDAEQSTDPAAVKLSIPDMQQQTEAGVYNGASHPLVALPMEFSELWGSDACRVSSVRFRQLGAIVELQLYSSDEALRSEKIRSVTFESETPLAGDFSFDLTTVKDKEALPISGYKSKEATTLLEEPAVIPATKEGAALVYQTIAPGQYAGNIVVKTGAAQYTFRMKNAMNFERAVIKGLPADLAKAERKVLSPDDNPSETEDVQIFATGASASQQHGGDGPEKLIDGDKSTEFHSPWAYGYDKPTTKFPFTLEFTFDGTKDMDYIKIYQRNSGNITGVIGRYELYYKGEGAADWTPVNKGDLDKTKGGEKTCYFPFTLKGVTDLRLVALEGSGNNENPDNAGKEPEGFVSAYEIEFFFQPAKSTINDAILNVFTDLSCSELKEGVTHDDITRLYAVAPYLAQEVALVMMENRYEEAEAEFRIHSYEPYSDTRLYKQLLTRRYSRMDNPTGIEAKQGDKLMVCVDKIPAGQSVSLAIYGEYMNGYGPNYGGMDPNNDTVDQEQELQAGLNIIDVTAPRGGMCYVMNTAVQLSKASQPVRVHILRGCGTLQGYFDLARHKTDEKYAELLSKCTYKYFVVKGKHMIFNFHTSKLRELAPTNILSGIEAWDNILGWQLELMGLDNVSYFNNHMMAVSTEDPNAYMDASNRRVNFSASTALHKIITYDRLIAEEDNTWGPSHELGHINQGAINWKSCSESSNNLFSNYAIFKMGKYGSRGAKISDLALSYAQGKSWLQAGRWNGTETPEDTELHMRMNWQLWNYFHRCGANPNFWPTLFQLLRDDPMPSEFSSNEDPGACQLAFYERACDAAQMDLTEFFETWGFFVPVDIEYNQYGTRQYTVTETMIADAKARVAAKWGNAKAPAIQYIEDRDEKDGVRYSNMGYYTTFQNKTNITKTVSCWIKGRGYLMFDNGEAVAIEIRKPEVNGELGKLVYFSNLNSFTVPDAVKDEDLSNTVVYAVQWDGVRKKVSVVAN